MTVIAQERSNKELNLDTGGGTKAKKMIARIIAELQETLSVAGNNSSQSCSISWTNLRVLQPEVGNGCPLCDLRLLWEATGSALTPNLNLNWPGEIRSIFVHFSPVTPWDPTPYNFQIARARSQQGNQTHPFLLAGGFLKQQSADLGLHISGDNSNGKQPALPKLRYFLNKSRRSDGPRQAVASFSVIWNFC